MTSWPTVLKPSTLKEGEEDRCRDVLLPGDGTCSLTGQAQGGDWQSSSGGAAQPWQKVSPWRCILVVLQVALKLNVHNTQSELFHMSKWEDMLLSCRLGGSSAFLEFRASNDAALNLYLKAGFTQVGRRDAYYANGEAAILMSRML